MPKDKTVFPSSDVLQGRNDSTETPSIRGDEIRSLALE